MVMPHTLFFIVCLIIFVRIRTGYFLFFSLYAVALVFLSGIVGFIGVNLLLGSLL